MRKLLYTTTALVGAAFLMEAAPAKAEINISGSYTARMVFSKSAKEGTEARNQERGSQLTDGASLTFTGSKDHPNGLTTGFKAAFDVDDATDSNNADNLFDDVYGSVGGSFGTVYVGNVGDAGAGVHVSGTPGTASFGIGGETIFGDSVGTNAVDNLIGRQKSIKYTGPDLTGFNFGVSYAPEKGKLGGTDGKDQPGDYNDAIAFGVGYSNSFAGTSVSLSGSYGTTSANPRKVSEAYSDTWQGLYASSGTVTAGSLNALDNVIVRGRGATAGLVDSASTVAVITPIANLGDMKVEDKDGSAFSFGASVGYQDFTFGGSWGQYEEGQITDRTSWQLGAKYKMDAFTFGIGYGQREEQLGSYVVTGTTAGTTGNITATALGYDDNAGKKTEIEKLSFSVDYELGDGANIDFGIENSSVTESEYNLVGNAVAGGAMSGVRKEEQYDETGFGVGISLSF